MLHGSKRKADIDLRHEEILLETKRGLFPPRGDKRGCAEDLRYFNLEQ